MAGKEDGIELKSYEELSQQGRWRRDHAEKERDRSKKLYIENLQKHRTKAIMYYYENPQRTIARKNEWLKKNPEKRVAYAIKWRSKNIDLSRLYHRRHIARRHRNFGYVELNKPFPCCHGHHINQLEVIYIPRELHDSIRHSLLRNRNMKAINLKAFAWLIEENAG
jgi:hypothetical protein